MARQQTITLQLIVESLKQGPKSPTALGAEVGASRATVHRKLEQLLNSGIVEKQGAGPRVSYQLRSAQAQLKSSGPQRLARLTMSAQVARTISQGLDLYTRLLMGQFEAVPDSASFGELGLSWKRGHESRDDIENLKLLLVRAKRCLTGYAENASMGVYHPKLHNSAFVSWSVFRALRHRLAWDATPSGSMGVHHDEPSDSLPRGVCVFGVGTRDAKGMAEKYVLEMPLDVAQACQEALATVLRVCVADFAVLADLAERGLLVDGQGASASEEQIHEARQWLAMACGAVMGTPLESNVELHARDVVFLELSKALGGIEQQEMEAPRTLVVSGATLTLSAGSCVAQGVRELPEGYLLNADQGNFRVIAPDPKNPDAFIVVGSSHSIQTAIQFAHNHANGLPSRSWGL